MTKLVPYVEVSTDDKGQKVTLTGTLDRTAIPELVATGQAPDGAVTITGCDTPHR